MRARSSPDFELALGPTLGGELLSQGRELAEAAAASAAGSASRIGRTTGSGTRTGSATSLESFHSSSTSARIAASLRRAQRSVLSRRSPSARAIAASGPGAATRQIAIGAPSRSRTGNRSTVKGGSFSEGLDGVLELDRFLVVPGRAPPVEDVGGRIVGERVDAGLAIGIAR